MKSPKQLTASLIETIDYRQPEASSPFVPNPPVLASSGWNNLHLEVHHQPKFEIAEHHHTMHVIACGLSQTSEIAGGDIELASGERWLDGKRLTEQRHTGDIAIIPAGIFHHCNWNQAAQFGILAIEPKLLRQVSQDWINPEKIELRPQFMGKSITGKPDRLIQGIFSALISELEVSGMGSHLLIDSLTTALAIHLLRSYGITSPKNMRVSGGLSSCTLAQIKDYIEGNLDQDLRLVDLSAIAQISPYHFLRLFKQSLGITPHQYILIRRLSKAKSLLKASDLSIAEIASRTGFCDQSHLTRCFHHKFRMTPKQFQQT
jgi:AraC family transcriptional regulator